MSSSLELLPFVYALTPLPEMISQSRLIAFGLDQRGVFASDRRTFRISSAFFVRPKTLPFLKPFPLVISRSVLPLFAVALASPFLARLVCLSRPHSPSCNLYRLPNPS